MDESTGNLWGYSHSLLPWGEKGKVKSYFSPLQRGFRAFRKPAFPRKLALPSSNKRKDKICEPSSGSQGWVSPPLSGPGSHQALLLMEPAGCGPDSQEEGTDSQAVLGRPEDTLYLKWNFGALLLKIYKRKRPEGTVGGVKMQNGLGPYPCVAAKNQEEYLGCGDPPWGVRKVPQLHTGPSIPGFQCQEETFL